MLLDSVEVRPCQFYLVLFGRSTRGDLERAHPVVPIGHRLPSSAGGVGGGGGVMGPPPIPAGLHVPRAGPSMFSPIVYPPPPPVIVPDPRRHVPPNHRDQAGPVLHPLAIPLLPSSSLLPHGAGSLARHPSSSGTGGGHQPVHGPTVFVAGSSNLQQMITFLQKPSTGLHGYNTTHQLYTNIRDSLRSNVYQGIRGAEHVVVSAQMIVNEHRRKTHTPVAVRRDASSH